MITILTGGTGNGKTAYIVFNEIKKAVESGRLVYTCGIPKLTLPTIQVSYKDLAKWHELEPKKNPFDADEVQILKNFNEGALIVIDEVHKLWPPKGTQTTPDVEYLAEHRHHNIDFVVATPTPRLVHSVLAGLAVKHLHFRKTWRGRYHYEYSEFQNNPATRSIMQDAVVTKYKIPTQVFSMYESASGHTPFKLSVPIYFYFLMAVFIAVPFMIYKSINRIANKSEKSQEVLTKQINESPSAVVQSKEVITDAKFSSDAPAVVNNVGYTQNTLQVVSTQYDWSQIGACVKMGSKCACYGDEGNKLVVPKDVCESAIYNGWAGRSKSTPVSVPVSTEPQTSAQVYPARDADFNLTNAQGMGSRVSPFNASAS